jgi:hypothetical protein
MSYIKKNISMRNINKNKICENDFWNDCVDFDNIQSNFNNYNKFINNNNNKKNTIKKIFSLKKIKKKNKKEVKINNKNNNKDIDIDEEKNEQLNNSFNQENVNESIIPRVPIKLYAKKRFVTKS